MACRPIPKSNLGVEKWFAYDFKKKKKVSLANIQAQGLILNFYSPICKPCIQELPALGILHEKAQKKNVSLFLMLSPNLRDNGLSDSPQKSFEEQRDLIIRTIQKDIINYAIHIPVLIMEPLFRFGREKMIQATPETLFFRMNPFRLDYSFIGPLTDERTKEGMLQNSRFLFALRKLYEL